MKIAILVVGVLALTACGSEAPGTGADVSLSAVDPPADGIIEVSSDSELAIMLRPIAPATGFEAASGLEFGPGRAERWQMSTAPATVEEVQQLADILDVDGEVREVDDGLGGGLGIGTLGAEDDWLTVGSFAEPTWNLGRSERTLVESGAIPCATLAFDDPNAGQCADGPPPTPAAPVDDVAVDSVVENVMSGLGVPSGHYRTDTFVHAGTTEVTVEFSPDGVRSDVRWSLAIAASGQVLSGSGPLRPPTRVDDVPTVGLDEALLRLSRVLDGILWPAVIPLSPPTTSLADVPVTTNDDPLSTVAPPTAEPGPLPLITGVEAGLASVWDVGNRKWLVPAVVVTGEYGFESTVPVIDPGLVRVLDASTAQVPVRTGPPLTVPTPPPTTTNQTPRPPESAPPTTSNQSAFLPESGPPMTTTSVPIGDPTRSSVEALATLPVPPEPDTPPGQAPVFYEDALNQVLVGEPLDGAFDRLRDAGWEVRTDDLDDSTETFTADLRVDRATILHRHGVVVAITVG